MRERCCYMSSNKIKALKNLRIKILYRSGEIVEQEIYLQRRMRNSDSVSNKFSEGTHAKQEKEKDVHIQNINSRMCDICGKFFFLSARLFSKR